MTRINGINTKDGEMTYSGEDIGRSICLVFGGKLGLKLEDFTQEGPYISR